jgi:hypothetical protein
MMIVKRVVFLHEVPVGIMACRQCFADPWEAIAQADIPVTTTGVAKFLETPVLLRNEKVGGGRHSSLSLAHSV